MVNNGKKRDKKTSLRKEFVSKVSLSTSVKRCKTRGSISLGPLVADASDATFKQDFSACTRPTLSTSKHDIEHLRHFNKAAMLWNFGGGLRAPALEQVPQSLRSTDGKSHRITKSKHCVSTTHR